MLVNPTFEGMKFSWFSMLVTLIAVVLFFAAGRWSQDLVIQGDSHGYYAYLPATFTYHDLSFQWHEDLAPSEQSRYWLYEGMGGHQLPKMTMGLALAWAPGFLLVKAFYALLGESAIGFEPAFQVGVGLTTLLFLFFGLSALLEFLQKRFSIASSLVAVLLAFFATNLMYYSIVEPGMGHVYSFSLLCLSINFFDRWLRSEKSHGLWLAALLFGWMVLIRPTNAVFSLVFLGLFFDRSKRISGLTLFHVFVGILPVIPQLIFWKYSTGNWIHYSYGDEKIYWLHPNIWSGLFSFRNGWLIYTPVAVFAFLGLVWSVRKTWFSGSVLLVLSLHVYVVFSWWCWYYGDSLSIRPMIDAYALLACGLAMFLDHLILRYSIWKWLFIPIMLFLVYNNVLQYNQYSKGQITGSTMTKVAFNALFLNNDAPGHLGLIGAYKQPDNDRLRLGLPERTLRDTIVEQTWVLEDFERKDIKNSTDGWQGKGQKLIEHFNYSENAKMKADDLISAYDRVLELSVQVHSPDFEKGDAVFVASFKNGDDSYSYQVVELAELDLKKNDWQLVKMFVKKPYDLPSQSNLELVFWMRNPEGVITVDEIKVRQLDCPWAEAL